MIKDTDSIHNILGNCPTDLKGNPLVYLKHVEIILEGHTCHIYQSKVIAYNSNGVRSPDEMLDIEDYSIEHTYKLFTNLYRQIPSPFLVCIVTVPHGNPLLKQDIIQKKIIHGFYLDHATESSSSSKELGNFDNVLVTQPIKNYVLVSAFIFNSQTYLVVATLHDFTLLSYNRDMGMSVIVMPSEDLNNIVDIFKTQWSKLSSSNQQKSIMNFAYYHQTIVGSLTEGKIRWISIVRNRGGCSSDTTISGYIKKSILNLQRIGFETIEYEIIQTKKIPTNKKGLLGFYLKGHITVFMSHLP